MADRLNLATEPEIKKVLWLDRNALPGFPQAAAKLLEVTQQENASMEKISRIIETDPGIAAQVLKIANSALYGTGREVTTLADAVVRLGLDEIKKQALSISLFRHMFKKGRNNHLDRLLFWRHSLAVAALGQQIARAIGYPSPEEAYLAGLLHDVGKIFLDLGAKQSYGRFIQGLSTATDLVIESEEKEMGMGHDEVGAYFCDAWHLPANLVAAVKYHHQPFAHEDLSETEKALISVVGLADFLCWTQGMGSFDFIRPPVLVPEIEKTIDLDEEALVRCILAMNKEVETISAFYQFAFPSPDQLKGNLLQANLRLSKLNTRYYFQTQVPAAPPIQDVTGAWDTDFKLGKSLARAKSVKEVLDILMYEIGRIFKPLHWSILLKDPKTSGLVFSVVVGENREKLQGAKLPKGEGIAGHIMESGESLIVADVSKDSRFSPRVDRYTGFDTQSVIGTPLKTGTKTFGVIELINRIGETRFTARDLDLLAAIAEYAAIAIERSYYTQALTQLATRDKVTGLKNRWSFERTLTQQKAFKIRFGSVFSLLIVSVQGLGALVRDKGQEACDTSLKTLVTIIDHTKRRDDALFRYSETTFLLLLPLTYADEAAAIKARLKDAVQLAISTQTLLALTVTMAYHTLNSESSGDLVDLVGQSLASSGQPQCQDTIAGIEEQLQPLVAAETHTGQASAVPQRRFGKPVCLSGHYLHPRSGKSVHIKVSELSLTGIGFTIPKSQALAPRDPIPVQFILDDLKRSVIKRQALVREVREDHIRADFYNAPPYAKNLGFYLINSPG